MSKKCSYLRQNDACVLTIADKPNTHLIFSSLGCFLPNKCYKMPYLSSALSFITWRFCVLYLQAVAVEVKFCKLAQVSKTDPGLIVNGFSALTVPFQFIMDLCTY